jgi:formylglycine-generating enzyme required for sulfatase activity
MEMTLIPAGDFFMGSKEEDLVESAPRHRVYLSAFYIDMMEISNANFAEFLNAIRPHERIGGIRWNWLVLRSDLNFEERADWWPTEIMYENGKYRAFSGYEAYPVITVNWSAADAYCEWAGKRLPTEAEWEKAARGGLRDMSYPWGNAIPTKGPVYEKKWLQNDSPPATSAVGNYYPNGYGVYDTAGNVSEWCSDWYSSDYYRKSPRENPKGPGSGTHKIIRGGAWYNDAVSIRVDQRGWIEPFAIDEGIGFRCVMEAE